MVTSRSLSVLLALALPPAASAAPVSAPPAASFPSLTAPAVPVQQPDSLPALGGQVWAEGIGGTGRLAGAVVELRQEGRIRRVATDIDGRYRISGLRPGPADLSVYHIAVHPTQIEVRLPMRGEVVLDLELQRRILQVSGFSARALQELARPVQPLVASDPRGIAVRLRALESSSGMVESGLIGPSLPGEDGTQADRVLYMRGSTVDTRMVILDGVPILTPFHVAGLVEPFYTELLGDAQLYLGGAPSPYDGGVSYLLDVDTRAAGTEGARGSVGVDGLTLRGFAETPLPFNGGILAGGRRLHGLQELLFGEGGLPYRFDDLLVRVGVRPTEGHALRLTSFGNRESVILDPYGEAPAAGPEASWGNRAVSLGYEGDFGRAQLSATAAGSRYASTLPILWEDPVMARGAGARARLLVQASVPSGPGAVRVGSSMERIEFRYGLDPLAADAMRTFVSLREERIGTTATGFFGEWAGWVLPDLHLRIGVRGDHFSHTDQLRVGPRVAFRYALGERVALLASGGRYHQVLPAPGLRNEPAGAAAPASLDWDPSLPVVSATHLVVGIEQETDRAIHLAISGFVKGFEGLGTGGSERRRASGTELRVSREGDRVQAWLGYGLSWFWTEQLGGATRFDGRHLLTLGAAGTLPGGMEIQGTLGYGAGLPLTAVDLSSASDADRERGGVPMIHSGTEVARLNSGAGDTPLDLAPQDDFLRLDMELGWATEVRVAGRVTNLRPYVKVLNALDRRDALFYYFDRWRGDEVRPLARRPLLPLAGIEWRF